VQALASKRKRNKPEVVGFLGVGLDNKDAHTRLTRTEHFFLLGGSAETHERLQDTAIRFNEALDRTGKPLREATLEEILDLFREAHE
jgi:hypothetical protein